MEKPPPDLTYLNYSPTPLQRIVHKELERSGVELLVKREDLNHSLVSGNKWWKLKYNLIQAQAEGLETLLTFGGAYSNHIYATSAAANLLGFRSIGIIRGEGTLPLNPTLSFARQQGMRLEYLSREGYRAKNDLPFRATLENKFGQFFLIPEGGTNLLAVRGCEEFSLTFRDLHFDFVFIPVGTAGTISGVIAGLNGFRQVVGVPVLKNGGFLKDEIRSLLQDYCGRSFCNYELLTDYHHGGYAKTTAELMQFVTEMEENHNLPLDHVYTGKLLWAVFEEIKRKNFSRGTTILAIHTGGLQGRVVQR